MPLTRLGLVAALALSFAGCGFDAASAGVENTCASASECSSGRCEEGRCVGAAELELVVEVVPATAVGGTARPAWRSVPFHFQGALDRDLTLAPTVEVSGKVRWDGRRVPAEIVFTAPEIPGLDVVRVRTTTFDSPAADGSDYSVRLPTATSYTVTINPLASPMDELGPALRVLPPLALAEPLVTPAPDGSGELRWTDVDFSYPATLAEICATSQTEGCTLEGMVMSRQNELDVPEEGLQVWLVDDETESVVSSRAETDAYGAFAVAIQPGASRWSLRVGGGEARPLFPRTTVDPSRLSELVIQVPTATTVRYEGKVERASGAPAASAAMELRSDNVFDEATGYVGEFEAQVITDAEGSFAVDLLAGEYQVIITPSDADLAVYVDTVRVQAPSTGEAVVRGQLFTVPARTRLTGSVRTAAGELLPMVSVQAIARSGDSDIAATSAAAAYNRSVDGEVYENGSFALLLDTGRFDLVMQPTESSGFPWMVVPDYVLSAAAGARTERYVVPLPAPIRGQIMTGAGEGLGGAIVRVYGRPAESEERYVLLGTSTSATEELDLGSYEILIPSALGSQ